jgi:HPt (histidine-containing phosphotransfer) domain-containing protein
MIDKEALLLGNLARIRERFLQRTQGELPLLREQLERIAAGDLSGLAQMRVFAHRINGAGATFDFAALGECARQVEHLLDVLIVASAVEPRDLRRLMEHGRRLELAIAAAATHGS